jgi:hypothetical protein
MALCPNPRCGQPITSVLIEPVFMGPREIPQQWRGLSYSCRLCGAILSVGPDPAAVQDDTVELVAQKIAEAESRLSALVKRRSKS